MEQVDEGQSAVSSGLPRLGVLGRVRAPVPLGPKVEVQRFECEVSFYDRDGRWMGGFQKYQYPGGGRLLIAVGQTKYTGDKREFSVTFVAHSPHNG